MIDPSVLANDIVSNVVTLVLPGALWALLFLIAWENPAFAGAIGFGRRTFWLLVPGALLASYTILPLGPIAGDWLAISFAGGLFPLLVAALVFRRLHPGGNRALGLFLLTVGATAAALLVLVLPVSDPIGGRIAGLVHVSPSIGLDLAVLIGAAVIGGIVLALPAGSAGPRLGSVVALFLGVLVLTFAASASLPGLGIAEAFPIYLAPPIGAGLVAVAIAPRVFPGEEGYALPAAYVAATFGVLVGADVLRQPPLYGSGPSGIYAIGGAGVLDLVYLSGLIAFGTAYAAHRLLERPLRPERPVNAADSSLSPSGRLAGAFREGVYGRIDESLKQSALAGREAADRARLLLGAPSAPPDRPWAGLPIPGWVVSDEANLASIARVGSMDGREGYRGWATARWLVQIGRDLGVRRFATIGARTLAFLVDLVILVVPAAAIWAALVLALPGGIGGIAGSIAFNVAAFGFIAVAYLYFVLSEAISGTTVGKALFRLSVKDRRLDPPGFEASLLRNASALPLLTIVGIGLPIAILFLLKSSSAVSLSLAGFAIPSGILAFVSVLVFVIAGVGILGAFGVLSIAVTGERQRLGDVLAGTWVVRTLTAASPPGAAPAAGPSG
jgi:uncharacterized RDD family membrane protein YckC